MFAGYVSVISTKFPQETVPELLAYMAMIAKFSKSYDDSSWARYDMLYRKQMAKLKDLRWSRLNPTLFNMCFSGKARLGSACVWCLSDNHSSADCADNPANMGWNWPRVEDAGQPGNRTGNGQKDRNRSNQAVKICFLYNRRNKSECSYDPCKYAHICLLCKGNHPRSECTSATGRSGGSGPGAKRPRWN